MSRGAKITLEVFVIVVVIFVLAVASWFIFKEERAQIATNYLKEGDKYLLEGNYALALISYKKAVLLTPRSFAPYFMQGVLAKTTGHYTEAIEYLNQSTKLGPKEASAYITLGETYLLNKDIASAQTAFLKAKDIVPDSDEIDFLLVKTALTENNRDLAQKYLLEAEKNNPIPKYKIYSALLRALDDPTESTEIIATIDIEVEINGFNLSDFNNLFRKLTNMENVTSRELAIYATFSQIGEVDFGISGLEKIAKTNPQTRDIWVFLGYSYLAKNESDKAKSALDKAKDLDPVFPATYYLLSKYYEQNKNNSQAQEMMDKAREFGFDEENPLTAKSK